MLNTIKKFSETLEHEIPGFIGFSVCEIRSGSCIYFRCIETSLDMELITKCYVDVIKAKLNAKLLVGITDRVDSIIVNLETQFHVVDLTKDNEFFFYMISDRRKSNLAIIMSKLSKCKELMASEKVIS